MLNGRTALVTGSVAGLGHAIAAALARSGASVVLNGLCPPADGHASNGPTGLVCHTGTSWHLPNWAVL